MTHSFPHRMLAVPVRLLLALFTDPVATVTDVAAYVALSVALWAVWLLIVRVETWIARHVKNDALDREYADLCASYPADDPTEAEHLPGVTHLGPTPPPARPVRRRMYGVRITGRRLRRHTTSSSSDRRR